MKPGIYFNIPFEEYLSIRALSMSAIKLLEISETDYWARSYMNPENSFIDEDSKAKIEGRAYHKRILEGKERFYEQYALDYEDCGGDHILRTQDDMKAALTSLGIKGLSGKKNDYLANLCAQYLPEYKTLYGMKEEHRALAGDRELISPSTLRHIEFTAKMIECHPDLKNYFIGGYPEVTIVFEAFGTRFKIRADYLKVWDIIDLKTFSNTMQRELKIAVRRAFDNYKYYIQGTLYLCGVQIAKQYASMGQVYGFEEVEKCPDTRANWLNLFSKSPCDEMRFCFVQKGVAPAAIPLVFHRKEKGFQEGFNAIERNVEKYHNAKKLYGTGYWITSIREEMIHFDELRGF